jgi:hypothetical protein
VSRQRPPGRAEAPVFVGCCLPSAQRRRAVLTAPIPLDRYTQPLSDSDRGRAAFDCGRRASKLSLSERPNKRRDTAQGYQNVSAWFDRKGALTMPIDTDRLPMKRLSGRATLPRTHNVRTAAADCPARSSQSLGKAAAAVPAIRDRSNRLPREILSDVRVDTPNVSRLKCPQIECRGPVSISPDPILHDLSLTRYTDQLLSLRRRQRQLLVRRDPLGAQNLTPI